jgi:hypothetical protein
MHEQVAGMKNLNASGNVDGRASMKTSSRCHFAPNRARFFFSRAAEAEPNLWHHSRTVSYVTGTPRFAIISSMFR